MRPLEALNLALFVSPLCRQLAFWFLGRTEPSDWQTICIDALGVGAGWALLLWRER